MAISHTSDLEVKKHPNNSPSEEQEWGVETGGEGYDEGLEPEEKIPEGFEVEEEEGESSE